MLAAERDWQRLMSTPGRICYQVTPRSAEPVWWVRATFAAGSVAYDSAETTRVWYVDGRPVPEAAAFYEAAPSVPPERRIEVVAGSERYRDDSQPDRG